MWSAAHSFQSIFFPGYGLGDLRYGNVFHLNPSIMNFSLLLELDILLPADPNLLLHEATLVVREGEE